MQSSPEVRRAIPLPERITLTTPGGALLIERRWLPRSVFPTLFASLFWAGFLAFLTPFLGEIIVEAPSFLLMPVAMAATLYTLLARLVNRTWITVARGELTVRHGPLPWWRNRNLPAHSLDQLYCERHFGRRPRGGVDITYSVCARRKDGSTVKLVAGLTSHDQGQYIEQQIERYLGIVDERVPSEMWR